MRQHEGLVQSVTTDGKALVIIRPGKPGIVGAPEVSNKVCHTATDGSTVRIESLNRAGAQVGDWVAVTQSSELIAKNAGALLGLPILGGVAGFVLATATGGVGLEALGVTVCVVSGVILGIFVGGSRYRKLSGQYLPVITGVIHTQAEVSALSASQKTQQDSPGCDLCTHCLK